MVDGGPCPPWLTQRHSRDSCELGLPSKTLAKQLQACKYPYLAPVTAQNHNRIAGAGCSRSIAIKMRPFVCSNCNTSYRRTCSSFANDADNIVTSAGHWARSLCLVVATTAPSQPLGCRNTACVGLSNGIQTTFRQNTMN